MEKFDQARTDEATAREIAVREGFRLVLAPAVTSTGGTYLLAASLLDPASGATLKAETVLARTKDDVLAAVDELSRTSSRKCDEDQLDGVLHLMAFAMLQAACAIAFFTWRPLV